MTLAHPLSPGSDRHHIRILQARQLDSDSNSTIATTSSTSAQDQSSSVTSTSSASITVSDITSSISSSTTLSSVITTTSSTTSSIAASTPTTSSSTGDLDTLPSQNEVSAAEPTPSAVETTSSTIAVTSTSSAAPTTLNDFTRTVVHTNPASVSVKTMLSTAPGPAPTTQSDNAETNDNIGGLPRTTFIIIIVVASVLVLVALAWTAFRKWKLRPSRRFDSKMAPVDFSPNGLGGNDDFLEKTLHRSASSSSLDRQRQQFIADLDRDGPDYVEGVPQHDFTAGASGMQYDSNMYNHDPFAHSAAYDYDTSYYHQAHQPIAPLPPAAVAEYGSHDYPTQDPGEGYSDLHRGNSGSSHGSHHGSQGSGRQQAVRPSDFPTPGQYLGRPTEGDGPYAQASYYGRF
ncbi:hypothetical protein BD324DRAFT_650920 [Kockovaella imperatae]|uniref:Uncharacterized protein n=1 Tax=Kockovaella imperatae TaxID=4999 RepID=A0A1Y1UGY8_9TREE|nr:hypothetical protein BD324DRAFT_650920 [Kockovaella imperatae]ORX37320.1 hypothetical protein BD324DRAFT_650920 [Kockovaella imperatae]